MKIAQIVSLHESVPPISQNGLEFVASWITEELVHRGHEVTLFAPSTSITSAKLLSLFPEHVRVLNDFPWRKQNLSLWNTTYALSHAHEFDIIHTHTGTVAFSMPFIKTPIVQTLHEPFDQNFLTYTSESDTTAAIPFVIDQLAKINYVSVSKNQQKEFIEKGKIFFKKISTIYNAIPVEKFEYNSKPKDYLFYIGYINAEKGADSAIKIARSLNKKLILAGNNVGTEAFFKQKIEPYLSDDIQYVGPVDFKQKVELYKNAEATIAPLRWDEPFGLTIIESQACGTPVISFAKGASPELIQDGVTGFVVETEDEMCNAVKNIKNIDRKNCRMWVEKNFSIDSMVNAYEKLYTQIIQNSKK